MTLFDVIFSGNDTVYDLTVKAVDDAIAANGADKAVSFPHTAYSLPCYYGVTGTKITNLGDMKECSGRCEIPDDQRAEAERCFHVRCCYRTLR